MKCKFCGEKEKQDFELPVYYCPHCGDVYGRITLYLIQQQLYEIAKDLKDLKSKFNEATHQY